MEEWPEDVVRAKGFFWIATRSDLVGLVSQAGPSIVVQAAGEWMASYPEDERKQIFKEEPELLKNWDEQYGDRQNELVMIGLDMNHQEIINSLEACLLTNEEMKEDWSAFKDPFPSFEVEAV